MLQCAGRVSLGTFRDACHLRRWIAGLDQATEFLIWLSVKLRYVAVTVAASSAGPLKRNYTQRKQTAYATGTSMTEEWQMPMNPHGTVGVGVMDGSYSDLASADAISQEVQRYLARSGLEVAPTPFNPTGSATGDFLTAVATGLVADVLVHVWKQVRVFLVSRANKKLDRQLSSHKRECYIHIRDRRGDDRDAVELLLMLPGLNAHLTEEFPNRLYSFVIFSATKSIDSVEINLRDYDGLSRTVRQMAKVLLRKTSSQFVGLYLQDGPFGSKRVAYNAV